MLSLTSTFNELLKQNEAPPTRKSFSLDEIDEFLKEAYRINSHIQSLHTELKDVRQAYLSTAQPRKTQLRPSRASHQGQERQQKFLTDRQREEIDANAKQMLRELNASIRTLADAEQLRHETELTMIRKKHGRRLGFLGSWAAGGVAGGSGGGVLGQGGSKKSKEHAEVEEKESQLASHRDSVLWFLRQRLQLCVRTQQNMMETRLTREVEKNHSVLAKARSGAGGGGGSMDLRPGDLQGFREPMSPSRSQGGGRGLHLPMEEAEKERRRLPADELTEEQQQMFEKGNQDMLKYYESTLDKAMAAEKSLLEISELQTVLVNSLLTQSANIGQLVSDSLHTEENVGGGNKQLKKATERPSTARYTFFAASGLCLFLIAWDLLI